MKDSSFAMCRRANFTFSFMQHSLFWTYKDSCVTYETQLLHHKAEVTRCQQFCIMQLEAQLRLCQTCLWFYKGGIRLISHSRIHSKSANHYELLGIKSDASLEEIKHAFFDQSKKVHPDSDPSNPDLHTQFVKLNEAYRVLSKDKSRKEYDLKIRHPYNFNQTYDSTFRNTDHSNKYSSEANESRRYWEQFRQSNAHNMSSEAWQKRRTQNQRVLRYCVAAIVLSVGVHYVLFRKLEEVHTNYMDEKDRVITAIYNEAKERARVNSFEKQKEILSQKHAEFLQKYKMRRGGDD